ncbi:hypothetical protein L7F22_028048 [Adiantum nelumboides]|nr:hypothetical protein [Adiantum nelumboides]
MSSGCEMEESGCGASRVLEVSMLGLLPMALKAALELKVLEILAQHAEAEGGYLSASQIASHMAERTAPLEEAAMALDRILRVLASYGLLQASTTTRVEGGNERRCRYGLTPTSSHFLLSSSVRSIAPLVLLQQHPVFLQAYGEFQQAVLQGGYLCAKVHGVDGFSLIRTDAKLKQLFHDAMSSFSQMVMTDVLATYTGFQALAGRLVDVGGGHGTCLSLITSKYPHIKAINFDLPHVVAGAPAHPGIEHVGGDMFETIPTGENIFMKHILHNWGDEQCLNILKNCHKSLPSNGKVILLECLLPEQVEHDTIVRATYLMDLVMLGFCDGGKERTKHEFEVLSAHAGFSTLQAMCNVHGISVIEIYKT